jgi:low temperature requirement protein LtrA
MELFFDLVYVFAVTQLSHHLLEHLTVRGAVETLVLFLAVWWAWNYTAWATNWIDPDHPAVRGLLVVLMLISLVMAVKIPRAFGEEGLGFATAYVALQAVRSAFMVVAFRGQRMGRNYAQLLAWTGIAGIAWVAGAFVPGDGRLLVWIGALVLDYGAPLHGFALPGLGRTPMRAWTLAGGHLAERNQQVVLIALGESILATGATFGELPARAPIVTAFVVGFVGTVSLWWLYFVRYAEEGARAITHAPDPARLGRAGYAYAHGIHGRRRDRRRRRDRPDNRPPHRPDVERSRRRDPRGAGHLPGRQCPVQLRPHRADALVTAHRHRRARAPRAARARG